MAWPEERVHWDAEPTENQKQKVSLDSFSFINSIKSDYIQLAYLKVVPIYDYIGMPAQGKLWLN